MGFWLIMLLKNLFTFKDWILEFLNSQPTKNLLPFGFFKEGVSLIRFVMKFFLEYLILLHNSPFITGIHIYIYNILCRSFTLIFCFLFTHLLILVFLVLFLVHVPEFRAMKVFFSDKKRFRYEESSEFISKEYPNLSKETRLVLT